MKNLFAAIVAAVALFVAAPVSACESVQAITLGSTYAAPLQLEVAPVVYQPVVQQVRVAAYSAPLVQQVVVKQQRVRRQPVRRAAQIVLPPYGCR